tara:strand:- start:272 stop:445 length:174 start_codon:yes stop_codon:yes gene_type:complete
MLLYKKRVVLPVFLRAQDREGEGVNLAYLGYSQIKLLSVYLCSFSLIDSTVHKNTVK